MTSSRVRRRTAAAILLTGSLLATGGFNPVGASEGTSAPQAASAGAGGGHSDGPEASKKGSFDITKKGSFDITE